MAGIFCVRDPSGSLARATVSTAHHAMDYRGIDGEQLVEVDDVTLGQQRFATTPEEANTPPPVHADGVWGVVDGRLDNRAEVARDLYGEAETERGDARLLLDAYREYGETAFERVVGVFACAIYDGRSDRVVLARDRVGIRTVYYGRAGDAFVAASDQRPILTCRGGPPTVDERKLAEYLEDHTFTPGRSFYEGVAELPPGHYAVVEDDETTCHQYWRPTDDLASGSLAELQSEIAATCRRAVESRQRSVGPVGTELSGGLDSTTVTALAASGDDAGDDGVSAYSLVFEKRGTDELARGERRRIADVVERYGLDHHEILADECWPLGDESDCNRFPAEGPATNEMAPAFEHLYEAATDDGHRVLLTGEGGHLFDGRQSAYVDMLRRGKVGTALGMILADDTPTTTLAWFVFATLYGTLGGRYPDSRDFGIDTLVSKSFAERVESTPCPGPAYPQNRVWALNNQAVDRLTFHSPYLDILRYDRRVALSIGLDLRHPLLDARVLDATYSLPRELLIRDGQRKYLLRRIGEDLLPESVRTASVTPSFTPLITTGLQVERERVESLLDSTELADRNYVTDDALDATLDSFYRNVPDEGDYGTKRTTTHREVWRLLTAERWLHKVCCS